MEAALLEGVIRRGREANVGIGSRPTVPPSRSKKPQQSSGSSLDELQEQLKRKKALLADKEVIDELPDKGARIRTHIAELEQRINALTHGYEQTSQTGATLEERLQGMSLDSANMATPATSSPPSTQPLADVALVRIPNPFKGNISAPTSRAVSDERREQSIYGRRELAARREKQREVKTLSLAECQRAEAAKEKEWMINEARNRLKTAAATAPASAPIEKGEGAGWTAIRSQLDDESEDETELPPIDDAQDGADDEDD